MTHTQTTYTNRIALRAGKKGARPAEVGALASVFEKSATELKQSKLLKCKQTLQIATFNVRTLNRIGQLPELIASAKEHKIDIICIQEHRYTHPEDIKYHETGNGWSLVTVSAWKNSVNAAVGGVGLLIGPRALKTLNSVEKIQPRMMAATFNGNPRATIISCYSPTNVSEETELVTFYDELSSLVRSIPKHNMLVIGGDMNAQIGKNRNNKYSLHNTSNRNGQHLTDFMIENRLACLNTNYQKREGKLWTYMYANNTKAQIDYVLINKKGKNSAMNCEAYSSFEGVSTDHRIVTAKTLGSHNIQQKVGACSEPGRAKGGNVGVILPSSAGSWRLRYGSLGTPPLVSRIVFSPWNLVSSMFVSHCPRHLAVSSQDLPHPHYFCTSTRIPVRFYWRSWTFICIKIILPGRIHPYHAKALISLTPVD